MDIQFLRGIISKIRKRLYNLFQCLMYHWKCCQKCHIIQVVSPDRFPADQRYLRLIIKSIIRITVNNAHAVSIIAQRRVINDIPVFCKYLIQIGTLIYFAKTMVFITFCSIVFQIRLFLRRHIVQDVIDHIVVCLFQLFYFRQWLVLPSGFHLLRFFIQIPFGFFKKIF